MATEPTLQIPSELKLPKFRPSVPDANLQEWTDAVILAVARYTHQLHTDLTYGHPTWPIYSTAINSNMMEGGFGMENDGTREYSWARINDNVHPITNHPQDYISYGEALQNAVGVITWTFPQGGFSDIPTVLGTLEGTQAHMQACDQLHTLFHTLPTTTQVTFYIDEWLDAVPSICSKPCTSNTVWVNAFAIGTPP